MTTATANVKRRAARARDRPGIVIRAVTRSTGALNRKGRKERKDNLFILCYPTDPSFAFFATFAVNPRCRKGHCSGVKRQARLRSGAKSPGLLAASAFVPARRDYGGRTRGAKAAEAAS